jgi:hypothetical protein
VKKFDTLYNAVLNANFLKEETEKKIVSASGVDGSGTTTVKYEDGTTEVRSGSRPIRNNNPGNLEYGDFAIKHGAVGSDGRYAVFPTKEDGWNAKINLLKTETYQNLSLKDAFNRYAPPNENPNYLRDLELNTGFDLNRQMSSLNDQEFQTLVNAVAKIEGSESFVGKYSTSGVSGSTAKTEKEEASDIGGAALANLNQQVMDIMKGGMGKEQAQAALSSVLNAVKGAMPAGVRLPF